MKDCELCAFKNPKGSVTGIILKDNKVLVLKRSEEPFRDKWDFPGGYMNEGETPLEAIIREIKEELDLDIKKITFIDVFPGTTKWKGKEFPVISHAFLIRPFIDYKFKLNGENSDYKWIELKDAEEINAFNTNKDIARHIWLKFEVDFIRMKTMLHQLDSTAELNEYNYYEAVLNGYVGKVMKDGRLVGMGWIYPRQTLLRKQAVIEDMIVLEAYRNMGIGKFIIEDLIRWAKENKIEVLELTTNPRRIAANELYKSVGFELHNTNHYLMHL